MSKYDELYYFCKDFVDNFEGWCELDDGDMIDMSLNDMKTALLKIKSTETSDNTPLTGSQGSPKLPSLIDLSKYILLDVISKPDRSHMASQLNTAQIKYILDTIKKLGNFS